MAVLPFMGAGQTHLNGQFKDVIKRGLLYLIKNGKPGMKNGLPVLDLQDNDGNSGMYSHGLATITLCEAYAMTEDPAIAGPAQAALNFITYAQCRDGGWRYKPQQSIGGDTSVVGWQVMALKSGHMGHLLVPPQTIQGSQLFLDKVSSNGGAWYGYDKPSASMPNKHNGDWTSLSNVHGVGQGAPCDCSRRGRLEQEGDVENGLLLQLLCRASPSALWR